MADSKAKNSKAPIVQRSQRPSLEQRKEIAKRLYAIAAAVAEAIDADRMDIYLQALADLPHQPLADALEGMVLTCRWFPKIPEIREAVIGKPPASKEVLNASAEAAWMRVLELANKWHPDIGALSDAPKISARDSRALRSAGDIYRLWQLQDEGGTDLDFMHKRFIEVWKQHDMISDRLELTRGRDTRELTSGFSSIADIVGGKEQ